jgi:hypothetical protein
LLLRVVVVQSRALMKAEERIPAVAPTNVESTTHRATCAERSSGALVMYLVC